ncbi:MAG: biosynthetic-type acetolactate synthase large subunit [Candidatus Latescibacteria bacterium]|nr:biosynthetic-type acetolactate synthase large subunit [Candidatus Latescibacterota bacterium]
MATAKATPKSSEGVSGRAPAGRESKPAAPQRGADILIEALVREGVEVIFGYPGGASMEIHQALTRSNIRVILARHEQGEIFSAEGYAKASGKVGVCVATSGPGATNLVTGIADAKMDSVPLVCITGQVPTSVIGKDAFQETPIVEITRQITKHSYLVDRIEDLPRVVKEAFYIARTGRPGPVLVDVPKNVQQAYMVPEYPETLSFRGYNPHVRANPEQIERVAEAIREARKPVIYAGGGAIASEAHRDLYELATRMNIPVTTTLMGLGVFPETHPLSLQMLGMHGSVYANYALDRADLVLALGVRFDDRVTGKLEEFAKHGKIVHIDVDASELNKNKPAFIPILSDLKPALQMLNRIAVAGDYAAWHAELDEQRRRYPFSYKETDGAILPQHAIQVLYEMSKGEAIITTGVGQHQMWAAQYYKFVEPRRWITSGGLGSMGFGLPAAIGAKLACPDREVIDIDGDGSFIMNVQELATAYTDNIPVKVVVINNQHLGMVVQWEDRFYESNRGHTFIGDPTGEGIYPDMVSICQGFRIPARRVSRKEELADAMREMLDAKTAYLLDVIVPHQEHVLPMIPSGKTFKDIIIE